MNDDKKADRHLEIAGSATGSEAEDGGLGSLLRNWQAPEAPATLDERVLASYRRHRDHPSVWRRIVSGRVAVPLPVAAGVVILFLITTALAVRGLNSMNNGPRTKGQPTVQASAAVPAAQVPGASGLKAPSNKIEIRQPGPPPSLERMRSAHPKAGRSTISLQSGEETIRVIATGDYLLIPSPKIYAGALLDRSSERQMP